LFVVGVTGEEVYGSSNKFDFDRPTKKEALKQLKDWGYKYIGVE